MTEDFANEALQIHQKLKDFENNLALKAKSLKILILGDYKDNLHLLEKIRDKLISGGYPTFLLKDLKNGVAICDYDAALILTEECDLIFLLDGENIGTGIECGIIMKSKHLQEKTIFLTSCSFDELCNIENPFFNYPLYDYHDTTHDDIIKKAEGLIRKEAYRRAKIYIEGQKSIKI